MPQTTIKKTTQLKLQANVLSNIPSHATKRSAQRIRKIKLYTNNEASQQSTEFLH